MRKEFKHEFKMDDVPKWKDVKEFWDNLRGLKFLGEISFRDFMLLSLLIWYGRRIGEITRLTVEDINFNKGERGIIYFIQLKTRKKENRKKVALPIIPPIKEYLFEYVNNEINPFGKRKLFDITIRQARNIVYKYTKQLMGEKLRPHAFRHAIGDYLTRRKGIAFAQYWLGHSSIAITQIYTHYNYKTIEEELPEEFR